jgi:hypothetical protein
VTFEASTTPSAMPIPSPKYRYIDFKCHVRPFGIGNRRWLLVKKIRPSHGTSTARNRNYPTSGRRSNRCQYKYVLSVIRQPKNERHGVLYHIFYCIRTALVPNHQKERKQTPKPWRSFPLPAKPTCKVRDPSVAATTTYTHITVRVSE